MDWRIIQYRLPTAVVSPCWYKHADITAELYAGMNMEYKVREEQAPSLSPMMFWHTNLPQMIYRRREAVTTAHSTQQFDRSDQGILYVRAGVVDNTGKTVAPSEPVVIKQPSPNDPLSVEIEYLSTKGAYNVLEAHWQRHNDEQSLVWETSPDGQTWIEAVDEVAQESHKPYNGSSAAS